MVSVVIPTYNDNDRLSLVLWGLTQQVNKDFEIIIVNDGGDDETKYLVRQYQSVLNIHYRYLHPKSDKYRPSAARNLGIEHAISERIIFIDGDVIPSACLIQEHSRHDDRLTIVAGVRYRVKEDEIHALIHTMRTGNMSYGYIMSKTYIDDQRIMDPKYSKRFSSLSRNHFDTVDYATSLVNACFCPSMNISYSRRLLTNLNGFDVRYDGFLHGEDHDLAIRALKRGARCVTLPDVPVYHLDHPPRAERNDRLMHSLLTAARLS